MICRLREFFPRGPRGLGVALVLGLTLLAQEQGIAAAIGNQLWVDTNGNGIKDSTEPGIPGVTVQLWTVGANGIEQNGGGDDVQVGSSTITDISGKYSFSGLANGTYYVRIPTPPASYPGVTVLPVNVDNGLDNDNNGQQTASGTAFRSPLIALATGTEPGVAVDGDDTNGDMTVDFGFANPDSAYASNLIDNASFELTGAANTNGSAQALLGYNGTGTTFGSNLNALRWVGGVNGISPFNTPVQRMQVLAAGNSATRVSWVESAKARNGKRYMLLESTNSCLDLRAFGGGTWSSVLQPGRTYEMAVYADNASAAAASFQVNFEAGANIFNIGGTNYQYFLAGQSRWTGSPTPNFAAADYNGWTEASANATKPNWRKFTFRFSISATATAAQIDAASILIAGAASTGPIVVDDMYVSEIKLGLGDLVWADANNNGVKDPSESGIPGVTVQLFTSTDGIAGNEDDALYTGGTNTTTTDASGAYRFTILPTGNYVVKVTPPTSYPMTSGTPVTSDNNINNDNNGSQPGGISTVIMSPVIALNAGTEPVNDGDTNADTDFSVDFGLFPGMVVGNTVFNDANNNGIQDGGESGISGVSVALLDAATSSVVSTTTTNGSGLWGFTVFSQGSYKVRVTPNVSFGLASSTVGTDNGTDNNNDGSQPGGYGTASTSFAFTLTPGGEPGSTGNTNTENTIDFGFRGCPTITVTPATLAQGTAGTAYSQTLSVSGGSGGYVWSVANGALPAGLALNPSTGAITGTPTASNGAGTSITFKATDSLLCSGSTTYTFKICPVITLSPATLPSGTVGTGYSQTLSASGGATPYTWTTTNGTLPAGLTLTTGGVLSGTPATSNGAGVSVTLTATDVNGCPGSQIYTLKICPIITVNPATLPASIVNTAYSQTLTATGGASPYTWSITNGTLPAGLNFTSAGLLSGTPTTTASQTFTVQALDANGCPGTKIYTLTPACPTIAVTPSTLPAATVGTGYSQSLTASNGSPPYGWTVQSGTLPAGVTLSSAGLLSGTPTTSNGTGVAVTLRATDSFSCFGSLAYTFKVCPMLAIAPATLPGAAVGASYSQTITASNGAPPYTYSVSSGTLPSGLTLTTGGVLSGTPTSTTSQAFDIRAVDANGCPGIISYTLAPTCPAISVAPASLPGGTVSSAYSQTITASGGTAPYGWTLTGGSLPSGLNLSATGVLSGTPTTSAATGISLTVKATDNYGCQATSTYVLKICPVINITPSTLATASVGSAYSQTLTASGGTGPYAWTVTSGTLPTGLTLSASGVISGNPTTAVSSNFTVQAMDVNGCPGTMSYVLAPSCPPIVISPATLSVGTVSAAYSQTLSASAGTSPYTWTVTAGTLPAGLTLSSGGVISGTPTTANGTGVNVTFQAKDANNCLGAKAYTIKI
ncbi:MAG: hypothetical protein JWO89_3786, partial [Verrucomicrobiaceae bacterium]|nr:hypothetical protein [Verrucomicrobiaceae bacterium]